MSGFLQKEKTEKKRAAANRTNIPTHIKNRVESAANVSLDDVSVHYNSSWPERYGALAYTQGNQVHIGPGQERHLPHELGHVVQQKLGRVSATKVENGYALNDDPVLERQADRIGQGMF